MWEKIPIAKKYYSDGYEVYTENLPLSKLEVGKRGINIIGMKAYMLF